MEISGANAVQRQLPEQMMQMMQQQMQQNGNQLPENTMQQMKVLFDNSFTQLMDLMVPIYAKYYTEEDLDNIIRFTKPVWRRMADAQPKIATDAMGSPNNGQCSSPKKKMEIFKSAQAQRTEFCPRQINGCKPAPRQTPDGDRSTKKRLPAGQPFPPISYTE